MKDDLYVNVARVGHFRATALWLDFVIGPIGLQRPWKRPQNKAWKCHIEFQRAKIKKQKCQIKKPFSFNIHVALRYERSLSFAVNSLFVSKPRRMNWPRSKRPQNAKHPLPWSLNRSTILCYKHVCRLLLCLTQHHILTALLTALTQSEVLIPCFFHCTVYIVPTRDNVIKSLDPE